MKKIDYLILSLIIVVAIFLRLYKIDSPLSDLHSWRQVDTAAVARNFSRDGINLLKPKYDDLSSLQTGQENPEGLRMVEFPIYNALIAIFHRYLPLASITVYGRIVSIFFSLISIAILYYLGLKEKDRQAAIFTSMIYAVFPFFVFFSRTVLPETTAVSFMMLSIFFLYISFNKNKKQNIYLMLLGGAFFALSVLTKPTTIFYGLVPSYIFLNNYRFDIFKNWRPYIFFLIALIPLVLWRFYITQFPEGIPASSWLFRIVNTFEGPRDVFFKPAFFRWIFMERIGILMMGVYGVVFIVIGLIGKYKNILAHTFFISAMIYLFTFQGGNVQHEYYQIIIFPAIALISGFGASQIVSLPKKYFYKFALYPAVISVFLLSVFVSFYKVKDYYNNPNDLNQIAELIQTFTKPDDLIVTDRLGDTTLLYLSDRKGAPAIYKPLNELSDLGYKYLVTSNKDLIAQYEEEEIEFVVKNDLFAIIVL